MIEVYKILTGKYDPRVTDFITLSSSSTRVHSYKIYKEQSNRDLRRYSFIHRSVKPWNNLPTEVVEAPSVGAFERRLDKLWSKEEAKFNPDVEINFAGNRMRTAQLREVTQI